MGCKLYWNKYGFPTVTLKKGHQVKKPGSFYSEYGLDPRTTYQFHMGSLKPRG